MEAASNDELTLDMLTPDQKKDFYRGASVSRVDCAIMFAAAVADGRLSNLIEAWLRQHTGSHWHAPGVATMVDAA